MLRNVPDRSRSFIATLFGRSAGPKRRRPARSRRRPIGAEQLESRAMLAGLSIDGGLSWDGWTNRGLSNQGGLYGSGGTTGRDTYEVYTTTFAFAGNAIEKNPVQAMAPAPDGFDSGRLAWIPGGRQIQVSAGAFQAGNTILGIGVRATTSDGSIAGFWPTIRFDLDNDSYRPASFAVGSDGRTATLNNDGCTSFTTYAEPGDFTVQFEGSASWRGSSINVREAATAQLPAATVQLPGGVGSGTSYDFAFRAFAQPAAKSYQMFLDMTAIPKLYGSVYRTFFPARAGVGTIGDRVTVSLNGLGSNNVVFDANLTLPRVDLDVAPGEVDEDGSQGLIYTFTRSVALPTPLTISYDVVGGSAAEGIDFTGLPPGTGVRSITIPANATTASVAVFPIPDAEIEYDEAVVLTLLPGAGYALGTRTVATGTIVNDDLPGTVTGQAWFDANDDGSCSASESPLSAIIVNLFDSLGSPALDAFLQPVAPTTIDAGATYQFPNLRPGSYTVSFTDTLGYLGPGTAGAVYAGIAIIQLAQTAIVDLLFSQVVIPEEPQAPPAPPTADTLTWDDFKEVDKSPDPKHPDRVAYTGWNDTIGEYETGTPTIIYGPQNGPFTAKVTLALKMAPSFTAVFDKAESWVVKGKQTPQLLEHERLHLRIAEYIAKKAELNFPANMKGVGEAQGNTKNEAATKAQDAAWDNDLVPMVDAFLAEWARIEKTITDLYDSKTETDHGRNPDQQAKWERDWQQRVDAELTKQGWKVQ